jgi:c-di-GMP-binding flagellar brake protein YcgR
MRRICLEQEGPMERPGTHESVGSERRRQPLFIVPALGVTIAVRTLLGDEQVTARLIDVSRGGCCIALPAAQAQTLVDNGACRCALLVRLAHYLIEYAAAVVDRRGRDMDREHYVHLCFNRVSAHHRNLLTRWLTTLPATCAW